MTRPRGKTWIKFIAAFVLGIALALGFLQSIRIAAAWWSGARSLGAWEAIWIGLLPVWVFIYFRYYSVFRPGCRVCSPENLSAGRHDGPRGA